MTFRFEQPAIHEARPATNLDRVAKARKALAAAEVAGRKAQLALDNARFRFNKAADALMAEDQPIEYDFSDTIC